MVYTTYFAKVKRLPTSITPVAISLYQPADCRNIKKYSLLAPTREILSAWKADPDEERYIRNYNNQVLSGLDPKQVYNELTAMGGGGDVAIVCYERSGSFCHRHLVAKWLKDAGLPVGGELSL